VFSISTASVGDGCFPMTRVLSQHPPSDFDTDDRPATLHRTIQTTVAEGLKLRYQPPKKLSHELFVLMMQLNEIERTEKAKAAAQVEAVGKACNKACE
jgi:hypothetical protein